MRLLWSGGPEGVSRTGEFYPLDCLCAYPKPYGGNMIPIHVGGSTRAAARRAGRLGDGWFPGGMLTPPQRAHQYAAAQAAATAAGRDPATLDYTRWGSIDITREQVDEFAATGVTRVHVAPSAASQGEQFDQMSALADRFGLEAAA
jgi:alkanesulfonate monooxygenase SsuD/methylene tetrahydromethanopterin reductase-like flavin-dependent oxidoreductase (luciferase family)